MASCVVCCDRRMTCFIHVKENFLYARSSSVQFIMSGRCKTKFPCPIHLLPKFLFSIWYWVLYRAWCFGTDLKLSMNWEPWSWNLWIMNILTNNLFVPQLLRTFSKTYTNHFTVLYYFTWEMKVIVTVRHVLVLGRSLRRNEGDCHCETFFSIRQDSKEKWRWLSLWDMF